MKLVVYEEGRVVIMILALFINYFIRVAAA